MSEPSEELIEQTVDKIEQHATIHDYTQVGHCVREAIDAATAKLRGSPIALLAYWKATSDSVIAKLREELGRSYAEEMHKGAEILKLRKENERLDHENDALLLEVESWKQENERLKDALEWYATATYPDDGSGRPADAFQRRAKEALSPESPAQQKGTK